ncbi:MAG: type IX secretion system PorP/SprF family membrane protein [Maribacter sp.]|jgi:type IX secretion system PorP/SprF family membrane protein
MKQFKYITIILFVAYSFVADAQQIPVLDQYMFNPYLYNPARAGDSGFGNLNMTNRLQWVEMPDAPLTNIVSFDMPLKNENVGIGAMLFSDETHLINNYGAMFTYAYHIAFSETKDHRLSIGLSGGVLNQRFDYLKGNVEEEIDNALLNETENTINFDFSAGINYHFKGLNVGFSVPQILNNKLEYREPANLENVAFSLERHYLVSASYKAYIAGKFSVEPLLLARMVKGLPVQLDGNVLLGYNDMVWLGVGYRSVNSISNASAMHASVAVRVKERFNVAYTYETHLSSQARGDLGNSHEFTVGYRFGGQTKGEKSLLDRIARLETKTDSVGGELTILKTDVEENDAAINARVDDLEGIINAEKLTELQNQVTKNTAEIDILKNTDQTMDVELNKLKNELSATKIKLADIEENGGSAYFDKMGSIYFAKGSSDLDITEKSKLDAINARIGKGGKFTMFLSGNASSEGSQEYNMALSVRRANAVKIYLQSIGMKNGNVFILPYGEEVPVDGKPNVTNNNDRRVDLYITN